MTYSFYNKEWSSNRLITTIILQYTSFFVLMARAWEHLFAQIPYTALLWYQNLMEPVINYLGLNWTLFASSSAPYIILLQYVIGIILFICALSCLPIRWHTRLRIYCIFLGTYLLIFFAVLKWMDSNLEFPHLIEYTSQWISPMILGLLLNENQGKNKITLTNKHIQLAKLGISLTFIGHGMYASGVYTTPGNYIDMMIVTFSITEHTARNLLRIIGIMDILAAISLYSPQIAFFPLVYCLVWGFMTSIARLYMYDNSYDFTSYWIFQFMVRTSHYSLPLLILLESKKQNK